jgi:DNA-binding transcriptional LysR family regulator
MRESGSGTQQRFEEALQNWGIDLRTLKVTLVLNTGEMVKAIIENSSAAAGISELMVQKELELGTLRSIRVIDTSGLSPRYLEFMRPFLKIKHRQRFQPRVCQVFEQML